jgi:hypothetical protein
MSLKLDLHTGAFLPWTHFVQCEPNYLSQDEEPVNLANSSNLARGHVVDYKIISIASAASGGSIIAISLTS